MIDPRALVRCLKCGQHISALALEASARFGYRTAEQRSAAMDWMWTCSAGGPHDFGEEVGSKQA